MRTAILSRNKYHRLKKADLCTKCGKCRPRSGRVMCQSCFEITRNYKGQRGSENSVRSKKLRDRWKDEIFKAYGGYVCSCCGETEKAFLTLDHVNGGGNAQRRDLGGGALRVWSWIRKNNFPPIFQILCFNCNRGKFVNGVCPHKVLGVGNRK